MILAFLFSLLMLPASPPPPQGTPGTLNNFAKRLEASPLKNRPAIVKNFIASHPTTPIIDHQTLAGLYWYGKAETVKVAGDAQRGWYSPETMKFVPCGTDTFFYYTIKLPADARVDYQLVIDGKYCTDPRNSYVTPSGMGPHSAIAMPRFKATKITKYYPQIPHGRLDSINFVSADTILKPRTVRIYLPPGYDSMHDLPTLYVHDGQEALDFAFFNNVLDNLHAAKAIKPAIVVFIPPRDRADEYVWAKHQNYVDAVCNELVPKIDSLYHTSRDASARTMMGISNGGHLSYYILATRPDLFHSAAGQSARITDTLLNPWKAALREKTIPVDAKMYFDTGVYDLVDPPHNGDFTKDDRAFVQMLRENGLAIEYDEYNDGHSWANWRERTEKILKFFYGK